MTHYKIFTLASVIFAILACTSMAQDTSGLPYMNPKLFPEERAAELVHRMTLEEKASQLVNQARAVPRLNIASYDWWSEALHGVISDGVTEFPEPFLGAASRYAPIRSTHNIKEPEIPKTQIRSSAAEPNGFSQSLTKHEAGGQR